MQQTWLTRWRQYLTESRIALNEGSIVIGSFTLTPTNGNVYIKNNNNAISHTYRVHGKSMLGYVAVEVKDFPSATQIQVNIPVVGDKTYEINSSKLQSILDTKFGWKEIYMTTKTGTAIKFLKV